MEYNYFCIYQQRKHQNFQLRFCFQLKMNLNNDVYIPNDKCFDATKKIAFSES